MRSPTHGRDKDLGVIQVLLDRLNSLRLPRVLELQERMERGDPLSSFDLEFLKHALDEAEGVQRLARRHPEYQDIVDRTASLYNDVATKGLQNERNAHPKPNGDDLH
jgi:hypothetical protein